MNGVISVYKEKGVTSFDVVREIRKIANTKKVGHTGTLDPLATGVLPICIGKATKLVDTIMAGDKVYKAVLKLGEVTDTYDREGKIISENKKFDFNHEKVREVVLSFIGKIEQTPPMYSAIKVNGTRLYNLARAGKEIEIPKRNINIYDIKIEEINIPFVSFTVNCSKGTYIRSLCYDIGEKLKVGATMYELERVKTGIFTKENTYTIDELRNEFSDKIISMEDVTTNFEKITFDDKAGKFLINGVNLKNPYYLRGIKQDTRYRVYKNSEFIGLGKLSDKGFKLELLLI